VSQLAAIVATLAAQTITVGTTTVAALVNASIPDSVESAQLPTRLILPTGGRQSGNVTTPRTFKTSATEGGVLVIDWSITDVLLWRASNAGLGLMDVAADLTAYLAAYTTVIAPLRTSRWSVTQIQFSGVGGIEWPAASERWYLGAQAILTIREIV
jgi:hypothetical protein